MKATLRSGDQNTNPNANTIGKTKSGKRHVRKDALSALWKRRANGLSTASGGPAANPCTIKATKATVMASIMTHKEYQSPGTDITIKDQPKYDCLDLYDVPQMKQVDLWKVEMERLWENTALSPDGELQTAPRFSCEGSLSASIGKSSYETLSSFHECLTWCWTICAHDNELITLENLPKLFDLDQYTRHRLVLINGVKRTPSRVSGILRNFDVSTFYELVDYLSATCARVLVQISANRFWQSISLAVLVMWATKMKVLARDPIKYAKASLDRAQVILKHEETQLEFEARQKMSSFNAPPEDQFDAPALPGLQYGPKNRRQAEGITGFQVEPDDPLFAPDEDKVTWLYFAEMAMPRKGIHDLLFVALSTFRASNRSRLPVDAFEISSMVFGSDLLGYPTLLSQDRDGEIGGSSTEISVRYSYAAFRTMRQVIKELARQHEAFGLTSRPPPHEPSSTVQSGGEPEKDRDKEGAKLGTSHTMLRWEWESDDSTGLSEGALELGTVAEVVAVITPLALTQPAAVNIISALVRVVNKITTAQDPVEPVSNVPFSALYYVRTKGYDDGTEAQRRQGDAESLSGSLLSHHRLLGLDRNDELPKNGKEVVDNKRAETLKAQRQQLNKTRERFKGWTIDERSISVSVPKYVATVFTGCFLLVAGGLAAGFTVGDRIVGVDPFNITTFSWAFAAFVFVIAKSVLVENWPWKDFLQGEVVCRSVSELSAVTGMDKQEIIAYLLGNEYNTILITRGPYNKPFDRRGEEGFSIDHKIGLRTLLRSGVIPVKVATPDGPGSDALHIFDLRRGWRLRTLFHVHDREDEDDEQYMLMCIDPIIRGTPDQPDQAHLIKVRLSWNRMIGIYNHTNTVFR